MDKELPEWRDGAVYRDILPKPGLKAKRKLLERDTHLLRMHGREASSEILHVASLTVLAWNTDDLMAVMLRLAARHERLRGIAENVLIDPAAADLEALKTAFRSALRRFSPAGVPGGAASGQMRSAKAQAAADKLRPYWGMPSAGEFTTAVLCKKYGISRPTAFLYLGKRSDAQQRYEAARKIAESNKRRKRRGEE